MKDEIFRFSIVRNPQQVSREKYQKTVLHLISKDLNKLVFYDELKQLNKGKADRASFITLAQQFLNEEPFIHDLSQLKLPFLDFGEWLYQQEKPNGVQIKEKSEILFGMDISVLVEHADFKQDKTNISDSIVVAVIAKPKKNGIRSSLMQVRRLIFLLEILAKEDQNAFDSRAIRKILSATVLLPSDLFPIPDNNEKRKNENKDAYDKWKENMEEEQTRIDNAAEKLKSNRVAIEELTQAYSRHLFDLKYFEIESSNSKTSTSTSTKATIKSIPILPADKFNKLSSSTIKIILDELKVSKDQVDIVYVINSLESKNNLIAQELGQINIPKGSGMVTYPVNDSYLGPCQKEDIKEPKSVNDFNPDTRGEVNVVGIQDLLIVRQELLTYKPGEIAHIENIMQGESKSKKHRKLDRTERTTLEETERTEEKEEDLQTTDRYELQNEASNTISEDTSREAGVTVTSRGWVDIEAHGNYSNNQSKEITNRTASTIARDVVNRSVQKVKDRVLKRRSRTDISEIEIINKHGLDNTQGSGNISGIYRWVDKYYKAQVVNYGKRIMLEFMIPEPAAFYHFALTNKPKKGRDIIKPDAPGFCKKGHFFELKPIDITNENFIFFVGKYEVNNVKAPPKRFIDSYQTFTATHEKSPDNTSNIQFEKEAIKAPEKYRMMGIEYQINMGMGHTASASPRDEMFVSVFIGEKNIFEEAMREWYDSTNPPPPSSPPSPSEPDYEGEYTFSTSGGIFFGKTDNVYESSLSVVGFSTLALSVNIGLRIQCERTEEAYKQWQIDTYNAIMTAYQAKMLAYEEALRVQEFNTNVNIQGRNPLLNREIEKTELKKHAISLLSGQQYESFNAMGEDALLGYPQIDLPDAGEEGQFVRFFEQALEWQHMTYLFYSYFWGNKKNWLGLINLADTDPLFEKFLQAGYARVWIPVRPEFNELILSYIGIAGEPWNEMDAPLPGGENEEHFVSLLDEIKEQLNGDFEAREGTLNVTKGEKNVIGTNTDFVEEDKDRELLIDLEVYRIAEVISPTQIYLREPYRGETSLEMDYAVGVKFVGEPWIVKVPTSLVYLQEETKL